MSEEHSLRETLEKLRQDLEDTQVEDDESRRLLMHLKTDVQDMLNRQGQPMPEQHSISGSLRNSILHFEVNYPTLTITMGRLLELLSQNGL